MFSCNHSSNKEVKDAKENLTEAKDELKDAQGNENKAEKAKETQEASFPGLALQKGMTTVACRKFVQIYTKPNLQSQTFGFIKLGQEVVIQERTNVVEAFDGLNYYWYN